MSLLSNIFDLAILKVRMPLKCSSNFTYNRFTLLLILCMLVLVTICSIYRVGYILDLKQKSQIIRARNHRVVDDETSTTVIIFWKSGDDTTEILRVEDCLFTFNKEFIYRANAIIFDIFSLDNEVLPWIHYRDKSQVYIWESVEAPPSILHVNGHDLTDFDGGFINWTMTYRSDSDVRISYLNMNRMEKILDQGQSWVDKVMVQKKNVALWLVSNCAVTKGAKQRMKFVTELLNEGLPVHRFGYCFKEMGDFDQLSDDFKNSFKFYLAFENSRNCTDYITEKFWSNGLLAGRVPVVWGPSRNDVIKLVPKGSYIYSDDFKDAKELTNYLLYLHTNRTAYLEYFKWVLDPLTFDFLNIRYGVNNTSKIDLCRKLKENKKHKIIPKVSHYFIKTESKECVDP